MKLCAHIFIAAAIVATPAQAQNKTASFPPNFELLPKAPTWLSSKDIDEKERRYRLTERLVFTVDEHVIAGRVAVEPIQSYAGSQTYIRRVLGVSIRFSF